MGGQRQNIQYSLALDLSDRGEPPLGGCQGTEPRVAKPDPESPAWWWNRSWRRCASGKTVKGRGSKFEGTRAVPESTA